MTRSDSRTHDGSGSAMILEFPAAGNSAGNSFGIGADLAFWKQLTQSFQWLAVNSLPLRDRNLFAGDRELSSPGQRFLRQGRELPFRDRRHEIKPCVAGQYPLIASASAHYWDKDIRPSQTRREHADNWQSAV